MKKSSSIFLSVLMTIMLFIISFSGEVVVAIDNGMTIKQMDINVNVSEDNIYDVTEEIKVNFLQQRHGIYRFIPMNKSTLSVKSVTNENGDKYEYELTNENGDEVIRIGDADTYVIGEKTYIINYEINYKGNLSELSYNIVGPEWDTTIDKVNFTINMPKEFNKDSISIYSGSRGSSSSDLVSYNVSENTITGETTSQLEPLQGITIEIPVGNEYFNPPKLFNLFTIIGIIMVTLVPLLAFKSSRFYNKKRAIAKNNITKVINFYPPEGFNPIDLAYIAYPNKNLTPEELTSILFYYANNGLIKIHNIDGEYELKKIKAVTRADFKNKYEYDFFNGLFNLSESKNGILKASDFKRSKLGFMQSFITLSKSENIKKSEFIENLSASVNIFAYIGAIILSVVGLAFYTYGLSYSMDIVMGVTMGVVIVSIIFLLPLSLLFRKLNFTLNVVIIAIIVAFIMGFIFADNSQYSLFIGSLPLVTLYISLFISTSISQALPSIYIHTVKGARVLGETEGYKEFISTARIQELEMLVKENPNYYYDILPYAICLKITNTFEKKFKDLTYVRPNWYYDNGYNGIFYYSLFTDNYTHRLVNEYNQYIKEQQASRSSSSSFGGVGGGSVGGGGGGSW